MMIGFQLKAAKAVTGFTANYISEAIGIHAGTIIRLCNTKNLNYLSCNVKTMTLLKSFFENNNILFPDTDSISWKGDKIISPNKITRFQLKAARIAANLTQEKLSFYLKVSSSTLSLLENLDNEQYIENSRFDIITFKKYFEVLGVTFPNDLTVKLIKNFSI